MVKYYKTSNRFCLSYMFAFKANRCYLQLVT